MKKLDYAPPPAPPAPEPPTSGINRVIAGLCAIAVGVVYLYAIVNTLKQHGGDKAIEVAQRGFPMLVIVCLLMGCRAVTGRPFRIRVLFPWKNSRR